MFRCSLRNETHQSFSIDEQGVNGYTNQSRFLRGSKIPFKGEVFPITKSVAKKKYKKRNINLELMNTKTDIPKPFRNIFNTWEDYRDWAVEKSKQELERAFQNGNKNR